MSRGGAPEQIVVRPTNNIYTALVVVCVIVLLVGLITLFLRHSTLFDSSLFS